MRDSGEEDQKGKVMGESDKVGKSGNKVQEGMVAGGSGEKGDRMSKAEKTVEKVTG